MAELKRQYADETVEHHIVFVHGLGLGALDDWASSSIPPDHWPLWLKSDLSNIAIWTVLYDASPTQWRGTSMSIVDRAENLLALLRSRSELQNGQISFVSYSFGGLVTKQIIRSADTKAPHDRSIARLLRNIRRVCFLGVPHFGADAASLGQLLRLPFRPSVAAAGLARNDPNLRDLATWYKHYASDNGIQSLSLIEARKTRLLGMLVKPDSADPGLISDPILVDADHYTIRAPSNRDAEVYIHVRDFLKHPAEGQHRDTLIADAIEHQTAGINELLSSAKQQHEAVENQLNRIIAGTGGDVSAALFHQSNNTIIDAEIEKRLWNLRKARFFIGFDVVAQTRRLYEAVIAGDLESGSNAAKMVALAWCARFCATTKEESIYDPAIKAALALGDCQEIKIAEAFRASRHNKAEALALLQRIGSPASRSAGFIIVSIDGTPDSALDWLKQAGLDFSSLDPDGKFFVIQKCFEASRWKDALDFAMRVDDHDFAQTPVLLLTVANARLAHAVADELRIVVLQQLPLEASSFPLGDDVLSLEHRRAAQGMYERVVPIAAELGCEEVAQLTSDRVLWLKLRDPLQSVEALAELGRSMREPIRLRRFPLALEFGLKLDLVAVENEIDKQTALSGGKSIDAALARFSIAQTKGSAQEVADYLAKHRQQLTDSLNPEMIGSAEVQMLARSGQVVRAEERFEELIQNGLGSVEAASLRRIIAESTGSDPVEAREEQFKKTDDIGDLTNLVSLLNEKGDWPRIVRYGIILFERDHRITTAAVYVHALYETADYGTVVQFLNGYPEFIEQSLQIKALAAWAHFQLGDFSEARALLDGLQAVRDTAGDRTLEVNIAISSGDWNSLLVHIEREWTKRADRTAHELLRAGQLAGYLGSARSRDLIYAAAEKGNASAEILLGCYSTAVSSGWEDDPQVTHWLQTAVCLSGEDGPIKKMSIKQIVELQPDWNRRETETWQQLHAGALPTFGAGRLLNRSLVSLFVLPAFANPNEPDLRQRGIVFAYCGNRTPMPTDARTLALDATALLTFALLGITTKILSSFERIVVAHSTMSWLFDERRSIQFHQPSRVRQIRELKRALDEGLLKLMTTPTIQDHDLAAEIGDDLASLLVEAKSRVGDEAKQCLVVKPYPVHRVNSMMEETVDLTDYQSCLCGCQDVIDALVRRGQLTAAEEQLARTYLAANELPWPHETLIADDATLYLDGIALIYFQHLKLLPKLRAAGFTVLLAEGESSERDALLRYESLATTAITLLDNLRQSLAEGLATGKVRLSPGPTRADGDEDDSAAVLRNHPTGTILHAASMVDAVVVDDRAINQHTFIAVGSSRKPVLTSFDILEMLHRNGDFDEHTLLEQVTRLRQAGFCFIPLRIEELAKMIEVARTQDGKLVETAELKAIRENTLRMRMTDVLQLPKEHLWLANLSNACSHVLKAQWREDVDDCDARTRSNWLFELFDWRGWMHRIPGVADDNDARVGRLSVVQLLTPIDGQPVAVTQRYWKWLQEDVLDSICAEEREAFKWLLEQAKMLIGHAVAQGEDILAKDHES